MIELVMQDLTLKCLFAAFVASIGGGFQHGYNTGVVNAPQQVITAWIEETRDHKLNETKPIPTPRPAATLKPVESPPKSALDVDVAFLYGVVVSIYLVGGMIGGLLTSIWLNVIGLKWGIIANNILVFISAALMGFSKGARSYLLLLVGRFICGINSGLNAGLTPMYLFEISPTAWRGTIGSFYQLFITIAIFISQCVSNSSVLGTKDYWQILFFLIAIVGVLQIIFLIPCPDSPKYLYSRNKEEEAEKALQWFRDAEDVSEEMTEIQKSSDAEKEGGEFKFNDLFVKKELRAALIISCMVMIAQQFSGINAIIYYSTSTFEKANLGKYAQPATLAIGVVLVITTTISVILVDLTGRRTLLLFAFAAMFIDTTLFLICFIMAIQMGTMLASYLCVFFLILFIAFFASGAGSIPWFLVSEIFFQNARPAGISIATAVNWISNICVGLFFPFLQETLGPYVFVIFIVLQFVFFVYIALNVPETKNRPIEEIIEEFK